MTAASMREKRLWKGEHRDAGDILRQRKFSYDHKVDSTVKCLQKQREQYRH